MPEVPPSPNAPPDAPQRTFVERRARPTPMISRYLFVGRRRGGRRGGERDRVYVDRHGPWVVVAFVAICGLSVADAVFTLHELSHGATEANPVMRAALRLGDAAFVVLKTVATIVGAAFLGLHKNWALGRACLWVAVLGYVVLTGWHLYGVLHVIPSARS